MIKLVAIDYETYYDKTYGIEEVGMANYIADDRFDPYLVSLYDEDGGLSWVGHPKDADWKSVMEGAPEFVSFNAAFDRQVHARAIAMGLIPSFAMPKTWWCSSNLSVFMGGPRSLKEASKHLLGVEVDKGMRSYMLGKTWAEAVVAGKDAALKDYALKDSIYCWRLWKKYNHLFPAEERAMAELTFVQTQRGIAVDKAKIERELPGVYNAREEARKLIPWEGKQDKDGEDYKTLSALAMREWLAKNNIPAPANTNAKSIEFQLWQKQHEDVPVIQAMQRFRSANALFNKGNALYKRTNKNGRFNFDQKFFGCVTGRQSGGWEDERSSGSSFNIFNLPQDTMFGFDLRGSLIPGPGKKFVISDFSQIEPRCGAWITNDQVFMKNLRAGVPLYEAHARASMGWKGGELKKESPKLYKLAKARVLALGYQAGWAKFIVMATMYGVEECLEMEIKDFGRMQTKFIAYLDRFDQWDKMPKDPTQMDWTKAINAWLIVTDFRKTNPLLTGLWKQLESDCRRCVGTDYKIELPSGRFLTYFNVKIVGGQIMVQKKIGDPHTAIWGGFMCENLLQAIARDVLRDACLNLETAGVKTLFTVYDEIISEVDIDFDSSVIKRIMTTPPSWMSDIPLDVSMEEATYYKK